MAERYQLPMGEEVHRYEPESTQDLLYQYWPGGSFINLKESFAVSQEQELRYTRYIQGEGGAVDFELMLSDEASAILHNAGKVRTKDQLKEELIRIQKNPFGKYSIDPGVKERRYRRLRSVNAFSSDLEERLGIPLAVKGSARLSPRAPKREDLMAQFRYMRQRENEWQGLPDYIRDTIRMCKVYASLRYPVPGRREYEEFLIMERVLNGQPTEDHMGINPETRKKVYGFAVDENPRLAQIIEKEKRELKKYTVVSKFASHVCYEWSALLGTLQRMGLRLSDLGGRNILHTGSVPQDRSYVLIDQRDRSK